MAFFNDLVRVIANVEGIEEITVRGMGINIRDKGLVSKGGRGLSAAKMTKRDAANLLIGVNASNFSKKAGSTVPLYRDLKLGYVNRKKTVFKDFLALITQNGENFGSVLEELIELAFCEVGKPDLLSQNLLKNAIDCKHIANGECDLASIDNKIKLEINFTKPDPIINMRIEDAYTGELIVQFDWEDQKYESKYDRYDITAISQKTLRAVSRSILD